MVRFSVLTAVLLALCISAFGQIIDPNVGFCPGTSTTKSDCFSATGAGGETIVINTATSFDMAANGAQDSSSPWYLLVAVPNNIGGAPIITSPSFTQSGSTADAGAFLPTTSGDIYAFASADTGGLSGDNSMNATNMFGSGQELMSFGSVPTSFEVFVYTFTPGMMGNTLYQFSSSALQSGTYLAAVGIGGKSNNIQFSTPFTTTGLVDATSPGPPPPVPEPASIVLLGTFCLGITGVIRRRIRKNSALV